MCDKEESIALTKKTISTIPHSLNFKNVSTEQQLTNQQNFTQGVVMMPIMIGMASQEDLSTIY